MYLINRTDIDVHFFQGLYGPKYVWFFIGWYEDNWFQRHLADENINCTVEQMEEAAEAHFTTEALQWNQDKSPTISGKVCRRRREIRNKFRLLPISRNTANQSCSSSSLEN